MTKLIEDLRTANSCVNKTSTPDNTKNRLQELINNTPTDPNVPADTKTRLQELINSMSSANTASQQTVLQAKDSS